MNARSAQPPATAARTARLWPLHTVVKRLQSPLMNSLLALLARFSLAAIFWKSGQTKVEGFSVDVVALQFELGWPRLSDSAVSLFEEEYQLPLLPADWAALMATVAEHVLPALLLLGLATRLSALGLLVMTAVIQLLVYPSAYPTHGVWAAALLYLMVHGPGAMSLDAVLARGRRA